MIKSQSLFVIAAISASLAAPLAAQDDTVVLTSGEVVHKTTITAFDTKEIKFKVRGSTRTASTDRVVVNKLVCRKFEDKLRRALSSNRAERVGNLLRDAEKLKKSNPFLAQFGYWAAAELLLENREYADAFQVFGQLTADCPKTGFYAETFRRKAEYYLSRGKGRDSGSVAKKYLSATQTHGLARGFAVDASFYATMAKAVGGELKGESLKSALEDVARNGTQFPDIKNKASLQLANLLLAGNKLEEAGKAYREILDSGATDTGVTAGAWLGLGKVHFQSGDPSNKAPYRDALLACLHVYVESPDASPGIVGEALELGAKAADRWGGPDSSRMRTRLKNILRRDFGQ